MIYIHFIFMPKRIKSFNFDDDIYDDEYEPDYNELNEDSRKNRRKSKNK